MEEVEEGSLRERKLWFREKLPIGERKEKVEFGKTCEITEEFLKCKGTSKDVDWRKENAAVLRDTWNHDLGKQDFPSSICEEEEEEDFSEEDSEDYDYDYADYCQVYRDVFNRRLFRFLHEEQPTDKKRNPIQMGKQLVIKAMEEGKDLTNEEFRKTEAGKEAFQSLFKKFADFPRTVMYMATITHSLS